MIPPHNIDEFKRLYSRRFGVKLSDADARVKARKLINLFKSVYRVDDPQVVNSKSPHGLVYTEDDGNQ